MAFLVCPLVSLSLHALARRERTFFSLPASDIRAQRVRNPLPALGG
jgi:hypothetical protein